MNAVSKEEYLKRYLSPQDGGGSKPKKKHKKKLAKTLQNGRGMKIVDDDAVWENNQDIEDVDDKLLTAEEKPQVAEVDNRTAAEKELDSYRASGKWKTLDQNDSSSRNKRHDSSESDSKLSRTRVRHDSDSDLELSRPELGHGDDSDLELPRKTSKRHDSDSDLELPRKSTAERRRKQTDSTKKHHEKTRRGDDDFSVSRTKKHAHHQRHDSDSDMDVPRSSGAVASRNARHDSDSDMELPRRQRHDSGSDSEEAPGKHRKQQGEMISGGKGGLTSVGSLRRELNESKQKETHLSVLADQYKDQSTVFRDRASGKRRNVHQEKKEADEKRRKKEEQYDKWGRGVKQSKLRDEAIAETLHESNKPLARYDDDEDLEKLRMEAIRDGDPMAAYIMKKKKQQSKALDLPKYRGPPPPPNRFGIQPGYRWDGVNRSNGFENKFFLHQSNEQANRDDFYKWSVGDM